MFNFLHNFHPQSILISLGPLKIHYYGIFIVVGAILAIAISMFLAKYYEIEKDSIIDIAFWVLISGIIGARIYHVLLEYSYYSKNPLQTLFIWQGGLAIHGGLIGGGLAFLIYAKKHNLNIIKYLALIVTGLPLAQAIGRWGNYFNQELFGLPTSLPWGIPIEASRRPLEFLSNGYFHPTFLYESFGNLLIFFILIFLQYLIIKKNKINYSYVVFGYAILYSVLRFLMEYIRTDPTPEIIGLRFPQFISIIIILFSIGFIVGFNRSKIKKLEKKS